jgi:hypothetical protein
VASSSTETARVSTVSGNPGTARCRERCTKRSAARKLVACGAAAVGAGEDARGYTAHELTGSGLARIGMYAAGEHVAQERTVSRPPAIEPLLMGDAVSKAASRAVGENPACGHIGVEPTAGVRAADQDAAKEHAL